MKVYRPIYVREFKCDGEFCGSRCCREWNIPVDEDTRKKFRSLADCEKFFGLLTEDNYLKPTDSSDCPFLGENFLCNLQLERGEDFLPAVCQSYPRVTYKLDDETFLQALTVTCPVAAIEILLREEPITFEVADKITTRLMFDFTDKIPLPVEKFLSMQAEAVKILQRRELSINRRLKLLCEFFGEHSTTADFDAESNSAALEEIFGETYGANLTVAKKSQLVESYLAARENILAQLHENFSTVLENYLVNEFVMRCYPFAFKGDEKFNCRVFVTAFRLAEFAAVLTALAHGRLTVENFAELLCALSDKLDHSKGGMDAIKSFAELHDAEIFSAMMLE